MPTRGPSIRKVFATCRPPSFTRRVSGFAFVLFHKMGEARVGKRVDLLQMEKTPGKCPASRPNPISRYEILIPSDQAEELPQYRLAVSDAEGHFSIAGLRPGTYAAYAFAQIEQFKWNDRQYMS